MVEEDAAFETVSSAARWDGIVGAHQFGVYALWVDVDCWFGRVVHRQVVIWESGDLAAE